MSLPGTKSTLTSTAEVLSTVGAASGTPSSSDSAGAGTGTGTANHVTASSHVISSTGSTQVSSPTSHSLSSSLSSSSSSPSPSPSSSSPSSTSTPLADQHDSTPSTSSQTHHSSLIAPIIGAIIGVLVMAVLVILALWLRRRTRVMRHLEEMKEEDNGHRLHPYMAPVVPTIGPTSTTDQSPTMSTQSLSRSPLMGRSPDPTSMLLEVSPTDPATKPGRSGPMDTFVPLKRRQRGALLPTAVDASSAPAPETRLRERVIVLEEQMSRMAATGAPGPWEEHPPAYDAPRILASQ